MEGNNRRFELRCTAAFLAAIDDWRVLRRPILSQAEAIRRLALRGIAVDRYLEVILRESDAELNPARQSGSEMISEKYGRWQAVVVQSLDHAACADLTARASAASSLAPVATATPETPDQDTSAPKRRRATR